MKDRQERLKELSQAKRALLLKAARKETTARQEARAIPRRPRHSPTPLSFAQQRLWFLDQLAPGSVAYNMPTAMRMDGPLDVGALRRAIDEIVRRHEALRTTFATVDEQPVQVIATALAVPFPLFDLQALPATERMAQALRLATEEARLPFDLACGPLVRARLLCLSGQTHVLLLTMHHIVSDGWSIGVMVRELAALYAAFAAGQPSPLPPLPIQYADFALWQRAWLQGPGVRGQGSDAPEEQRTKNIEQNREHHDRGSDGRGVFHTPGQGSAAGEGQTQNLKLKTQNSPLQTQLAYWRQQLSGRLPVLELPSDRPRPAVQTFHGAERATLISAPLAEALTALSRAERVTLFMTLLATFQVLLHRYSGQDDLIVGSPIANRERFQTEGLIGFFVNQLVLRGDLRGNPTFRELLARVREVCLGAYAHQDLPFEMLVEKLQPERDLSRTPLFQVMFVLQNAPQPVLGPSELSLSPLAVENKTTKFDLTLALSESAQGLAGGWEYSVDLFDAATIARMDEHFQTLLHGAAADPDLRLGDLPLLTEAERQQLLVEWNATRPGVRSQESGVRSETACIHHLFEAQAARTPDAIALVFDGPPTTDP